MKATASYQWVLLPLFIIGGIGLTFVPAKNVLPWRNIVRDALRPGQLTLASLMNAVLHWVPVEGRTGPSSHTPREVEAELKSLRLENRQLRIQTARLKEKLSQVSEQQQGSPGPSSRPSLAKPQLIEARVIGEETGRQWRGRQFLAIGSKQGIVESAVVLESTRPLVDLGSDAEITSGDSVYAGRIVIGKIAEVGNYSSTLRLVTDPDFSGRARIARRTSRGSLVFGAEGTLTSDGSGLCRLMHITEPVNTGDEVYTGGADGLLPAPMYYGKVVRAELEPGAQDWSIWVKPAASLERLENVSILRQALNPDRILGN